MTPIQLGGLRGKIEGERRILIKFIKAQFGDAGSGMLEEVAHLTDLDLLDGLTDKLFQVSRIEEARKLVKEAFLEQSKLN
jgi:hypothetical protein